MIEIRHVNMVYPNGVRALNDINLTIDRNEFVFVVGASGAGKSTLIRLLGLEFPPTVGKIKVLGKELTRLRRREIPAYRRSIGVVFQDFRLLENRCVYDNVAFAMQVVGARPRDIRWRVPEALEAVGLLDKARMKPQELSGGEQQRVCLARAIVNNPSLIIADEPTGNLDPKTSMEIMEHLKAINIRGATVIIATHDREIVNSLKKRVIALENGRIIRDEQRGEYS